MKINLKPDNDISTQKQKIGGVPTLILQPKAIEPAHAGLLWIHGGGYITEMKEMVYMSRAVDILKLYGGRCFLLDTGWPGCIHIPPRSMTALPCLSIWISTGQNLASTGLWWAARALAADVYPTNVHAFDMLYPEQELAKQARKRLLDRVGFVLAHDQSSSQSPFKRYA